MSYKKILFNYKAKNKIIKGLNILANAVKITLGPKGKNVIIEKKFSDPVITKDGVTVAKEIELKDSFENLGAQLVKEVASKTNEDSGDGTTTATILAQSIVNKSFKYIISGVEPDLIKKQIERIQLLINERLLKVSKKINTSIEISQVGSISSNNDYSIGNMISRAIEKIGKNGVILVEDGKYLNDKLEIVKGMQIDRGYMSPYFLESNKTSIVLEDCYILIHEKKIDNFSNLLPILEKLSKVSKPLLIISDGVENDILTTLILNNIRGIVKTIPVKSPSFGERKSSILDDISTMVGGNIVRNESNIYLKNLKLKHLGRAKRIEIKKDSTTIVEGFGSKKKIKLRINELKKQIKKTNSEYDIEKIKERISKLSGGIAVIKVGGATEIEMKERKYRIEDALNATKSAIENGIVPGGGIALIRISEWIKKKYKNNKNNIGFKIIFDSIREPFKRIMKNGCKEPGVILDKIKNKYYEYGFDLSKNRFCNMVKCGVIDPTKVVMHAIKNAVSIANLIIISDCVICENKNKLSYDNKAIEGI